MRSEKGTIVHVYVNYVLCFHKNYAVNIAIAGVLRSSNVCFDVCTCWGSLSTATTCQCMWL